jgi:hypothetical protein
MSYLNVEELRAERGIEVDHVTFYQCRVHAAACRGCRPLSTSRRRPLAARRALPTATTTTATACIPGPPRRSRPPATTGLSTYRRIGLAANADRPHPRVACGLFDGLAREPLAPWRAAGGCRGPWTLRQVQAITCCAGRSVPASHGPGPQTVTLQPVGSSGSSPVRSYCILRGYRAIQAKRAVNQPYWTPACRSASRPSYRRQSATSRTPRTNRSTLAGRGGTPEVNRRPGRHARRHTLPGMRKWDLANWARSTRRWDLGKWSAAATIVGTGLALLTLALGLSQADQSKDSQELPRDQAIPASMTSDTTTPATTTTRPTTTARATATTLSAAAAADSIWASVEANPAALGTFNDIGYALMVPRGARIIGGPPGEGCEQFHPWVAERGGVSAQSTFLRLVLQGKQSNAVLLSSLRARIVERRAPLVGTPLVCGEAAGAAEIRFIQLDLDRKPAVGVHAELTDTMRVVRRRPVAFTLKKNETEIFDIWAITSKCYCSWVIELDLVVNGTHTVKTVKNKGQPFKSTAWSGGSHYTWAEGWYGDDGLQPRNTSLKPLS